MIFCGSRHQYETIVEIASDAVSLVTAYRGALTTLWCLVLTLLTQTALSSPSSTT